MGMLGTIKYVRYSVVYGIGEYRVLLSVRAIMSKIQGYLTLDNFLIQTLFSYIVTNKNICKDSTTKPGSGCLECQSHNILVMFKVEGSNRALSHILF